MVQYLKSEVEAVNMAYFFQKRFPEIIWQTTDPYLLHRKSIISCIEYEKFHKKMAHPLELDVENTPWEIPFNLVRSLQDIVSINIIHVAR